MDASITIVTILYIVILVVPGVFFKRFYFQGPFANQFQSGQFADRFVTSLFWGMVTQVVTFFLFINTFNVEYSSLFEFLTKTHEELKENKVPNMEFEKLTNFLLYLFASVTVAIFLGHMAFQFVRLFKLDINTNVFRFSNKWHYHFSGEILRTKEFRNNLAISGKVEATLLDVLVKYGEGDDRLFSGNLIQFTTAPDGNLETLYLAGTRRYSNSKGENIPAKEIPGDCFVIPYQNVLNMNVQYILSKTGEKKRQVLFEKGKLFFAQLFIFFSLIGVFLYPWYFAVSILAKIGATFLLLFSWVSIVIFLSNFLGDKKEFGIKGSLFLFTLFGVFLILGLWILGVPILKSMFELLHFFENLMN
ncbi:MAG: hypothetical protein PSV36_05945 [Algoriphagus sp.]|nr:hypothetical protein [Algoriphagus sp.]